MAKICNTGPQSKQHETSNGDIILTSMILMKRGNTGFLLTAISGTLGNTSGTIMGVRAVIWEPALSPPSCPEKPAPLARETPTRIHRCGVTVSLQPAVIAALIGMFEKDRGEWSQLGAEVPVRPGRLVLVLNAPDQFSFLCRCRAARIILAQVAISGAFCYYSISNVLNVMHPGRQRLGHLSSWNALKAVPGCLVFLIPFFLPSLEEALGADLRASRDPSNLCSQVLGLIPGERRVADNWGVQPPSEELTDLASSGDLFWTHRRELYPRKTRLFAHVNFAPQSAAQQRLRPHKLLQREEHPLHLLSAQTDSSLLQVEANLTHIREGGGFHLIKTTERITRSTHSGGVCCQYQFLLLLLLLSWLSEQLALLLRQQLSRCGLCERVKDRRVLVAGFRRCGIYPLDPMAIEWSWVLSSGPWDLLISSTKPIGIFL
ncbi:hypothetical protein EYF80_012327 [Liparis tanakae]|uniref:Uncharacterized protein n=1 Tax=Liparis tanakae TaxID=230148 RepID=A0A4Z2IK26_9TELE|nr:hypothetical protein EYF80_012327 [Liparis tanakae]